MLSIKQVNVSYDNKKVLEDINLEIKQNQIIALIGPSGTGKSTLINSITALRKIDSGQIELNGNSISPKNMTLAWIPQNYGLLPWLSVEDNLLLGLKVKKEKMTPAGQKEVQMIIEELKIADLLTKFPNQLSGGQQQRISIARAMLMDSDLYLLDEPFSALDAITRENMQHLFLAEWEKKQAPTILITHDVEEAVFMGHKIALLSGNPGQIVEVIDNPSCIIPKEQKRLSDSFYQVAKQVREVLDFYDEKK